MFDIQYKERFGKREESIPELLSILKGIAGKLINNMDILYEWARVRDLYMHNKYGVEINEKTLTSKVRKESAAEEANLIWYDPRFESDYTLKEEDIREAKARRKLLVAKANEIAIMVIQFDNVVEEIGSRTYDECFNEDSADIKYKEGMERLNIDEKIVNTMLIQLRGLRNSLCHNYAFHKVFLEMSIGKIIFSRLSILLLNKTGQQLARMHDCAEECNQPGLGVVAPHNPSAEDILTIKWVSLPIESIRKEYFKK